MSTINKDEAKKQLIVLKADVEKLEKIINQPANIKDRVKTFADACEVLNIKTYGDAKRILGLKERYGFKNDKSIFDIQNPTLKIKIIVFALNEGWKPDWNDVNQYKYYPCFDTRNGKFSCYYFRSSSCCANLESGLYYKSSELSIYAGNQFTELYKEHFLG